MMKVFKNLTVFISIFILAVTAITAPLADPTIISPMCDLPPEKVHQ